MSPRITEPLTLFGRQLKALLKECKMSGSELARRLGLSQSTVSIWLTGTREPTPEQLLQIAACLGIAPERLTPATVTEISPEPPEPAPPEVIPPAPESAPPFEAPPSPPAGASAFEKQFWRRAAALAFAVRYQFYSAHPLRCPECRSIGQEMMLLPILPTHPTEVDEGHLLFWICPAVTCSYRTSGDLLNTDVFFRIANEFPGFGPP